ncbi:MAG: NYN domain-containing protein [Anaerolineales bacterium]|nr:NYN domain-containing protein [Anaerolineales bacterium]MDP3185533.1 NYN domain-containing protein [Anaerolineales bacterium]
MLQCYNYSDMPYLIDGHNLIPKLGLRLDAIDDELALVTRLQQFCRLRRAQVEVYFDGAPPGQPTSRKFGAVTAYFIRQTSSADAAIEGRLEKLGKAARNWTVVSSDHRVQNAARAVHAQVISAEEFARLVTAAQSATVFPQKENESLTPAELEEWLTLFGGRKKGPRL